MSNQIEKQVMSNQIEKQLAQLQDVFRGVKLIGGFMASHALELYLNADAAWCVRITSVIDEPLSDAAVAKVLDFYRVGLLKRAADYRKIAVEAHRSATAMEALLSTFQPARLAVLSAERLRERERQFYKLINITSEALLSTFPASQ